MVMRLVTAAVVAVLLVGLALVARAPARAVEADSRTAAEGAQGAPLKLWVESEHRFVTLPAVTHTEAEWKTLLPAGTFRIMRQAGTEIAFTGKYWDEHRHGVYRCAADGTDLFQSEKKFESGTGWPSFWAPVAPENVLLSTGGSLFGGVEVRCRRCGGHLGHVFDDGPRPTGKRYCMNSAALQFVPQP
jgi:peptide-methionine (R)-S-oxide reductase